MRRKKAVVDEKMAQATRVKGLILVLAGNGKGKSSSGFGMTARIAWNKALGLLRNPVVHLVLLDELNIALKHGYLPVAEVIEALRNRPPMQHVVVTGRGARPELIESADVKHAFRAGIRAQKGIEL